MCPWINMIRVWVRSKHFLGIYYGIIISRPRRWEAKSGRLMLSGRWAWGRKTPSSGCGGCESQGCKCRGGQLTTAGVRGHPEGSPEGWCLGWGTGHLKTKKRALRAERRSEGPLAPPTERRLCAQDRLKRRTDSKDRGLGWRVAPWARHLSGTFREGGTALESFLKGPSVYLSKVLGSTKEVLIGSYSAVTGKWSTAQGVWAVRSGSQRAVPGGCWRRAGLWGVHDCLAPTLYAGSKYKMGMTADCPWKIKWKKQITNNSWRVS